ncbi:MAG: dihydroorotase [Bacteroidetes bacterium]|nr:dihydroorotase [Bacteroidota bacterium]
MSIIIRQAKVLDSSSPYHGKKVDILVERGVITEIRASIKTDKNYREIEGDDLYVSQGWLDLQADFSDPGFEHKEDIQSGLESAARGGFTGVCVMSGTNPPLHNKAQIEYVLNRAKDNLVDVYPIGTISHNKEGKDLSEMYDMKLAGAVAFSDHKKAIKDAGLVMRALQYSQNIGSFIITHADDKSISHDGQMNEGVTSTRLGLKGIPALAEELMIQRNIQILEHTGGKIHFPTISTRGSVDLIKKAKANGLQVTAGVAAHNILLDDTALEDFDTNYKVNPPLRSKEDVSAIRRALENGVIDVVVSDHLPQDTECKDLEFDLADAGIIGLQTAYNCLVTAMPKLGAERVAECLAEAPRRILGLEPNSIKEGQKANLTVFSLNDKTTLSQKQIASKSKNTPFIGKPMNGRVVGLLNNNKVFIP